MVRFLAMISVLVLATPHEAVARPNGSIKLTELEPSLMVVYVPDQDVDVVLETNRAALPPELPHEIVMDGFPGRIRCEGRTVAKAITLHVRRNNANASYGAPVSGSGW